MCRVQKSSPIGLWPRRNLAECCTRCAWSAYLGLALLDWWLAWSSTKPDSSDGVMCEEFAFGGKKSFACVVKQKRAPKRLLPCSFLITPALTVGRHTKTVIRVSDCSLTLSATGCIRNLRQQFLQKCLGFVRCLWSLVFHGH